MIAIPWYFIEIIDKPEFFAYSYIVITSLTLFGVYTLAQLLIGILEKRFLF